MVNIVKNRVIDWDNQLRKERDFNDKFGTNLSMSEIKELTGSFRRLTDKSMKKIGTGELERCEEFYLTLDLMKKNQYINICKNRSAAFYKIGDEPNSDKSSVKYQMEFDEWNERLKSFKAQNGWNE